MPPSTHDAFTDSLPKHQNFAAKFKTLAQKPQGHFDISHNNINHHIGAASCIPYPEPPVRGLYSDGMTAAISWSPQHLPTKRPGGDMSLEFSTNATIIEHVPQLKRPLLESAPINEARPRKRVKIDEDPLQQMEISTTLPQKASKPTYASLIAIAILSSSDNRLTLSQIYNSIAASHPAYKMSEGGWQNSIRHNLSLCKSFEKEERPKDDPGKGHYWRVVKGHEQSLLKDRAGKKPSLSAVDGLQILSGLTSQQEHSNHHHQQQQQPQQQQQQQVLPAPPPLQQQQQQQDITRTQEAASHANNDVCLLPPQLPAMGLASGPPATIVGSTAIPELSSDATIDAECVEATTTPVKRRLPHSDPATITSSPPEPRHVQFANTPPRRSTRDGLNSETQGQRRTRDSGYGSFLNSSIAKHALGTDLSGAEDSRTRSKRSRSRSRAEVRAEDEIARLRASSVDSPLKGRSSYDYPLLLPSSSPVLRALERTPAALPLDPLLRMQPPHRPVTMASPGTQLRSHRDGVESMCNEPFRQAAQRAALSGHIFPWSPGPPRDTGYNDYSRTPGSVGSVKRRSQPFSIFEDAAPDLMSAATPVASSAKRPSVGYRGSPLGETTKQGLRRRAVPQSRRKNNKSSTTTEFAAACLESPSKILVDASTVKAIDWQVGKALAATRAEDGENDENSPTVNIADWLHVPETETVQSLCEEEGIDIMGGFDKIGSSYLAARIF